MFIPALATGGLAGWSQLSRTLDSETRRLNATPMISRNREEAAAALANVRSVDDLMDNRRLLEVVLVAHNLADKIDSPAFVRKVLAEGTSSDDALANRLADSRWKALADRFHFDKGEVRLSQTRIESILADYSDGKMSEAVSEEDPTLGTALRARKALDALGASSMSDRGKIYTIIGDDDLRAVFETALGLPSSLWQLDLDDQVGRVESALSRRFGGIEALSDPERRETILERFIALDGLDLYGASSSGQVAMALLQSSGGGTGLF